MFELSSAPPEHSDFLLSELWRGPAQLILCKDLHDFAGNGRCSLKGFLNTSGDRHVSA